jgi:arginyl-tRNA synthetase
MNFDLALAKKQSDENPVFYLQYAHARICSILKMVSEQNLIASLENLHLLNTEVELQLIKKLHQFREEILKYSINSIHSAGFSAQKKILRKRDWPLQALLK